MVEEYFGCAQCDVRCKLLKSFLEVKKEEEKEKEKESEEKEDTI